MAKKPRKSAKTADQTPVPPEPAVESSRESEAVPAATTGIEDPIGDTSDGEGQTYLGDEPLADHEPAASEEDDSAFEKAAAEAEPEELETDEEPELAYEPAPPAKLERLQKILSQAGVASRRKAEEMIAEGRVQVNGTVVTELGTKADPERDHIRVDGKLLHGAERLRYFVLNKPKGYVTTVSDPEGRPTVMKFFEKMRERLYPVGRLDYQSEGLLLMTNDGELANKLTKAGSGVEKTYLVKVAGQPTEEELDQLRGGVAIDRGKPGSGKVHTSPARIRQVRQGDNPWYEVVLIEGRNRELRKMFSAVGHFVEKIRRVGYGPLVLDVEPGKLRELDHDEIAALRLAAEGKLRKPMAKEGKRGGQPHAKFTGMPKPEHKRPERRFTERNREEGFRGKGEKSFRPVERAGGFRPKRAFGAGKPDWKQGKDDGRRQERPFKPRGERPRSERFDREGEFRDNRPPRKQSDARRSDAAEPREARQGQFDRPTFKRSNQRPGQSSGKPRFEKRAFGAGKPDWKQGKDDRRQQERPFKPRGERLRSERFDRGGEFRDNRPPRKQFDARRGEPAEARSVDRDRFDRPAFKRSNPRPERGPGKPRFEKRGFGQQRPDRREFAQEEPERRPFERPRFDRARGSKPAPGGHPRQGFGKPKPSGFAKPKPSGFTRPKKGGFGAKSSFGPKSNRGGNRPRGGGRKRD